MNSPHSYIYLIIVAGGKCECIHVNRGLYEHSVFVPKNQTYAVANATAVLGAVLARVSKAELKSIYASWKNGVVHPILRDRSIIPESEREYIRPGEETIIYETMPSASKSSMYR